MADEPDDAEPDKPVTDEDRRWLIVEHMANSDIDGRILVQNMDMVYRWMKDGVVPAAEPVRRPVRAKIEASNG
jgi:hypothetical protein